MLQRFNYLPEMFSSAALARPEIAPEFNYPVGDLAAGLSAAAQALARILAIPGLEAAYFPYIPGLTQPFVGTTNASSWPDSSGKGRPLLQATGAAQPSISGSIIVTDGSVQSMATSAFSLPQPYTLFVRMQLVSAAAAEVGILGNNSNPNRSGIYQKPSAQIQTYAGTSLVNPTFVTGSMHTLTALANGASSVSGVDETEVSGDASTVGIDSGLLLALWAGVGFTSGRWALGGIALSRSLTLSERQQVRADINTLCAGIT